MTSYPELPIVDGKPNFVSYEQSVHDLLNVTDECNARAVFAIMIAEAAKGKDSFKSAGGNNYSGVQTDAGRWGYSKPIIGRFSKIDSGGKNREFAAFKNSAGFFDFMANRIKAKGFNGCNADQWTNNYIQKWWSPTKKNQYGPGSTKYNEKKAIYQSAMRIFDKYKNTNTNTGITKSSLLFLIISGIAIAALLNIKK